jgi:hypothetical protein
MEVDHMNDVFVEVEKVAGKLRAARDKARTQAETAIGDAAITAALGKFLESHRQLVGFLHDYELISGRRNHTKESRTLPRDLVGSEFLQKRLDAMRHGIATPTVKLPAEAAEVLDRLRAVPRQAPKIFEGRAEFVQYLNERGLVEEIPGREAETAQERRAKYGVE